ncbi:hypothetical protein FRB96_000782 [Tulasnella sp. 330]|nr:hypothetical protein FRB96_000782 [Tulasnella sp. 330]KAG8882529.1 hypothetical protein FRB97_008155 [Tulasnella sp. 331]KAG8888862.1 hypothetical protein FRB98_006648 [Tulasnella sp. 332]
MVKFHGLVKLHITHFVIAFFGAMTCAPASGSLKAYGNTRLPPDVLLEDAYETSVLITWKAKAKALFTYWEESLAIGLFPGASNGFPGEVGQYDFADGSATVMVMWQFASIFSTISLIFLGLHIVWHLIVTVRHVRTRPHVFLEAVSGDFAWHLKPDLNAHKEQLPTARQDGFPLEPLGTPYLKA